MSCKDTEINQLVMKYVLNELSSKKAQEFEEHLFNCDSCSQELSFLQAIINEVESGAKMGYLQLKPLSPEDLASLNIKISVLEQLYYSVFGRLDSIIRKINDLTYVLADFVKSLFEPPVPAQTIIIDNSYRWEGKEPKVYVLTKRLNRVEEIVSALVQVCDFELPATVVCTK